jgi:isoamylase
MQIVSGKPYPLGATWDGLGVNFAIFSEHGTKVELCLFDSPESTQESQRIVLPEQNGYVWHGYLKDIRPGQIYGYRVYGPYDPAKGHRFNPNKVLVDPYARCVVRGVKWDDNLFGYTIGDKKLDLSFDERDSAATAPLCAVVDPSFIWGEDRAPETPWNKTIIYEAHVKGFTKLNQLVPEELRGTYAAIASEPVINHLTDLGITAIELMPVHHRVNNRSFIDRGLHDYWGYNTLSFFAPDNRFASMKAGPADHIQEFKMMVRALHAAGIEVILDVVYNHTVEGSHMGPTLSFRGVDNKSYYRTVANDNRYYMDYTGCGNTLNMVHPRVIQLIMDSLRYWVEEMHVDGFRFDLASALARELFDVNNLSAFFDVIQQDPVISRVKLIAEPWDVGPGGYQVGNFPVLWTEWNGKYRDLMRSFVKGDAGQLGQFASRLTGSSDLYEHSGRKPHASINFVTCHDGFTLTDLVSYNNKHNEANGEENKDGENHNNSWNCGVEGPSQDPNIIALRYQQKRNLIALLFFSIGVPMLSGGDELGRTQKGNNNAYCHDDEISWYQWDLSEEDKKFLEFVKKVIAIRKGQLVIQRKEFFKGEILEDGALPNDIIWLSREGRLMEDSDWTNAESRIVGVMLEGATMHETDVVRGTKGMQAKTLLLLCNTAHVGAPFFLPEHALGDSWKILLDTSEKISEPVWKMETELPLKGRSVVLLELHDSKLDSVVLS